ncbi:MAG: YaiI/YqxD family protein [Syntrophales bacterium]
MRILVDADGFPGAAKELVVRAAIRLRVPLVFVANKRIRCESSAVISSIIVPDGPDVADDRIVEMAEPGDLVITADVPLADRVVTKGAFALDPRGKLYTETNIKDRLAMRDLLNELRDGGLLTGGPPTFSKKDCQAFVNQLDSFLVRQLKTANPRRAQGE